MRPPAPFSRKAALRRDWGASRWRFREGADEPSLVYFSTEKGARARSRGARERGGRRGGRPHLGVAAGKPVGRACGASWARACAASSPSPWPPASPSCRSHPWGEPGGSQGQPGGAGRGEGRRGGTVPGELIPADVVHKTVVHVQPPARLAAETRPGVRRRFHLEPWARGRRRTGRLPPRELSTAPR